MQLFNKIKLTIIASTIFFNITIIECAATIVHQTEVGNKKLDELLIDAISEKNIEAVKKLIAKGADPNYKMTQEGIYSQRPVLSYAIDHGTPEIVKILLKAGADIECFYLFETPLITAVRNGHLPMVKLLLESGANINTQEIGYGYTPLMEAIIYNRKSIVYLLLTSGADLNVKNKDGFSALDITNIDDEINKMLHAAQEIRKHAIKAQNNKKLLFMAINKKNTDEVSKLLSEGADPNARASEGFWEGVSALSHAIGYGTSKIVDLLLQAGANPNYFDTKTGYTLLMNAAFSGNLDAVKQLLSFGANIDTQSLKSSMGEGRTALIIAVIKGHTPVVDLLLKSGANLDLKDDMGYSALGMANYNRANRLEIIKMLEAEPARRAAATEERNIEIKQILSQFGTEKLLPPLADIVHSYVPKTYEELVEAEKNKTLS